MPRPCCTEPKCSRYAQPVQGSKSCLCERDELRTPEEFLRWIALADAAGVPLTLTRAEVHVVAGWLGAPAVTETRYHPIAAE